MGVGIVAAQARPPERRDPSWKILLPLALPFAVLLGIAVFAILSPYEHVAGPPPGRPGALVWGDGIFANKVELKAWLRLHGGSYRVWVRQHPAALHLVTARPHKPRLKVAAKAHAKRAVKAHAVKARPSVRHATRHAARHVAVKHAAPTAATRSLRTAAPRRSSWVMLLFAILGALALGAALLPRRFLARMGVSARAAELRVGVAAAGVAILTSVGLTLMIG